MAAAEGIPKERLQRIIDHVNQDHKESLSLYLQHRAQIPAAIASASPHLSEVSLERMLIHSSDGHQHVVRFEPSLASWSEIRPRLVAMDGEAREALGLASGGLDGVVVSEYVAPRGIEAFVLSSVVFYFACYAGLPLVVPGSLPWRALEAVFPGGPTTFRSIVRAIFWGVVSIHSAEAILFDRTRLAPYGVPRGSRLWWMWVCTCWVEGFTCWKRIDRLIASKKARKEEKKH
jgi:hypothetical protein